jgi:rod shape-determining protein MreD
MRGGNVLTILISFFIGFLLTITPIAPALNDFYPIWIIPLLIYWLMATPQTVGLCTAWLCGFLLDVVFNSLLGVHALALLIVAAFFSKIARRFCFFSRTQQMLVIGFFTLLYLIILNCTAFFSHQPTAFTYWPILTTPIIWPLIAGILRYYHPQSFSR